jgi:hypothetical protein
MTAGTHPGTELWSAVVIPMHVAQIAGTAGVPGNLQIDSYQTITKAMLRIRPRQPGKPERALLQTVR